MQIECVTEDRAKFSFLITFEVQNFVMLPLFKNIELRIMYRTLYNFVMHVLMCFDVLVMYHISIRGGAQDFPKVGMDSTARRYDIYFSFKLK